MSPHTKESNQDSTTTTTTPLPYAKADKSILREIFSPFLQQPKSFIHWVEQKHATKNKLIKRPVQKINAPSTHLSLSEALRKHSHVGLVCSSTHSLIALDIDGVRHNDPLGQPELYKLIKEYPTYHEQSPSGKPYHSRLIYSLITADKKALLKPKVTHKTEGSPDAIELFNSSNNFVTLTGKVISKNPIAVIDPQVLIDLWPHFASQTNKDNLLAFPKSHEGCAPSTVATLSPIQTWLDIVPCAEHDDKVQKYILDYNILYHDYWLRGIMALHYTFGPHDGYNHALRWSQTSGDDFDEQELVTRWDSLGKHPDYASITERTYQQYFNACSIPWPVLKGKSGIPEPSEISNFTAFLEHQHLTVEVDSLSKTIFLDGPDHALYPTIYQSPTYAFSKTQTDEARLAARLIDLTRKHNFRPNLDQMTQHLSSLALMKYESDHINRFAREITRYATKNPYVPHVSKNMIQVISQRIIQRDPDYESPTQPFQDKLVRRWLLSLGRYFWPEDLSNPLWEEATAEGMLILAGQQGGINKSSFGERLFPKEWRTLYTQAEPSFIASQEDKDYKIKVSTRVLVDYDEVDQLLSTNQKSQAKVKSELTAKTISFRPAYGRGNQTFKKQYSHLASTNRTDLEIPREGARRFWWLNVGYIDTYAMDDLNMYDLWAQIKYELAHAPSSALAPWLLSKKDIPILEAYLMPHRTENALEGVLLDIYDYSDDGFTHLKDLTKEDFPNSKLPLAMNITKGIVEIAATVNEPKSKALHEALKALGKQYAPTITAGRTLIKDGYTFCNRKHCYLMPRLREQSVSDGNW